MKEKLKQLSDSQIDILKMAIEEALNSGDWFMFEEEEDDEKAKEFLEELIN